MRPSCALITCLLLALPAAGQESPTQTPQPKPSATAALGPRSADVASTDSIVAALYEVISGPAGTQRDWARFHHLFHPQARLAPVSPAQPRGGVRFLSPTDYEQKAGPYLVKKGFFESEIHRVVERFGPLAHVYSTYESRHRAEDEKPFARGINSIQLIRSGARWFVLHVVWAEETDSTPIPKKYLP